MNQCAWDIPFFFSEDKSKHINKGNLGGKPSELNFLTQKQRLEVRIDATEKYKIDLKVTYNFQETLCK